MRVVSVNAGGAEQLQVGARSVTTGIRKAPVERGFAGALGLVGDVVADQKNHGGLDQALYVYSADDYAFWADDLGGVPEPGTFGENVTVSSLGAEPVRIGDQFRVGEALLEVTAPRIPCSVFATRMEEGAWVKRFADARRPGVYVRVVEPGEIAAGDAVERLGGGEGHPTVVDLMDVWYDADPDPGLLERLIASPLAERARANVERKLVKARRPGRSEQPA